MNINKKRRTPEKRNKINDKRYNQSAWKGSNGVRQAALKRDGYLCQECKRNGNVTPGNVADHIEPVTRGGSFYDLDNIQTLCTKHHQIKSQSEVRR